MSHVDNACRTFTAGAAIAKHLRVHLSSGKLAAAGATDDDIGTLEQASSADGDDRAVRLGNAPGTRRMIAAGAISVGAKVYTAASGKISATQATGAFPRGVALTAATADGDIIEVYSRYDETAKPA